MERIQAEWPLRSSADPVSLYVQGLGERLGRGTGVAGAGPPHFFVVRNLAPTAFAVGAGRFVVTDGLFSLVRNESELAAVLAHEIGHERAGHFCRAEPTAKEKYRVGSLVQHFDPTAEAQADAAAVDLLAKAGFDPAAMESVLRCIAAQIPSTNRGSLEGRIDRLRRIGIRPVAPVSDSKDFRAARREAVADLKGTQPLGVTGTDARGCEH